LKQKSHWLEQFVDSSHVGLLVVDKDRNNLFVNDYLCKMFGYTQEELLEANAEIFHVNHDTFLEFAKLAFECALKGESIGVDYQFRKKDGTVFWCRIVGDNIKGKKEVLWTLLDITLQKELALKNSKLAQMVEQTHDGVISTDLDGNILTWNMGAEYFLGYSADEVKGKNISIIYPENELNKFENVKKVLKDINYFQEDLYTLSKKKEKIYTALSFSLLKNDDKEPIGIVVYAKNINKRKTAEEKLEETNYNLSQYLDVIDKIDIGLFVVDEDFRIRYMNNTMIKWFGDQRGKICYSSVANLDEPCPYCKLKEVIVENKKVVYEPTTPSGQSFDIVATSIKNADGTFSKMEVIRNVTQQKKAQEKLLEQQEMLYHQAHHDALTGLANRVLFNDRLEQAIKKAQRNNTKMVLFFIDLDHFKEINDSMGHEVGDEVLKEVTHRLRSAIRKEDSLARLGGDEFTIIIENLTQVQDASFLAKKILDVLAKPIIINGNKLYVSSSIGISLYPDDGISAQNLLKYADSAMYKAKSEGRNNFQFYSAEMTELAFERVVMETSLRAALENNELVVYYQPQVNGKSGQIIGMEALVRWKHSTMGLVSPAKFIPLAESTGLIVEIDRFVMKTAMTQMTKWYEDGLKPGVLAMNLAVKQLQQKDFVVMFENLMKETRCKSDWVELEVTESQIMTKPEEAVKILNKISEIGVELAVDDFGTGYSSLAYLKKLPIDKLKIDQSFVRDLPDDEDDRAIAKAVIALAKSLNLEIIAEGVETKEQKDFLIENGCENIQGYYYSRPIPADEFEVFLLKDKML